MSGELFFLDDAYIWGKEQIEDIRRIIRGRPAGEPHDYGLLAQMVHNAGDGDHVEIGTYYGASAILAAQTKLKYRLGGRVVCIDPLDGYYGNAAEEITPGVLRANAQACGVSLRIVRGVSTPWPAELENNRFVSAFIDGWHWGDVPLEDFRNLSKRVARFILFDNYDERHPDVVRSCLIAAEYPEWIPVHVSGISFLLERSRTFFPQYASNVWHEQKSLFERWHSLSEAAT